MEHTELPVSEEQIQAQIRHHLDEIRRLRGISFRSDWHQAFEASLRLCLSKYGDAIRLLVEEELGWEPPRTDFIVLVEEPGTVIDDPIFSHFRGHNILEYKNPHDELNENILWKAAGYAGLYINANHVDAGQVTITVFRAGKNQQLFERNNVTASDIPGVYTANGFSTLPFRVIITDELKGEQYASFRALTDRADEADVEKLINQVNNDESIRRFLRTILNLISEKNPGLIEELKGRDDKMTAKWKLIFKDEIEEERTAGKIEAYNEMVLDGTLTIEKAAQKLNMTVADFKKAVDMLKVTA